MKKTTFFIPLLLLFCVSIVSCSNNQTNCFKIETIETVFTVTKVSKAKYSKVEGYILYNGIKLQLNNGNTGYHYKEYNLSMGDEIVTDITLYYYSTRDGYRIEFSHVDVSGYER